DRCTGNIKKIEPSIPKGIETDTKYPLIKMIIQTLQIRFFPYKGTKDGLKSPYFRIKKIPLETNTSITRTKGYLLCIIV
ncbi:hypothetical protein, partial [Bacteroides fragilis]|uniref:hypothetical protein n=1 Tax=Bacteroides fragilis TaxID=817 RepID=UPI0032EFE2F2